MNARPEPKHRIVSDAETPESVNVAALELAKMVKRVFGRAPVADESVQRACDALISQALVVVYARSIPMPPLAAVYLPEHNCIEIVRADLERAEIRSLIARLIRKYHGVMPDDVLMADIAYGVLRAFPHYRGTSDI